MSLVIFILLNAQVYQLGLTYWFFAPACTLFVAFWTANWEEYHTGVLNTNIGAVGLTEGQLLMVAANVYEGISGNVLSKLTLGAVGALIMPAAAKDQISSTISGVLAQVSNGNANDVETKMQ